MRPWSPGTASVGAAARPPVGRVEHVGRERRPLDFAYRAQPGIPFPLPVSNSHFYVASEMPAARGQPRPSAAMLTLWLPLVVRGAAPHTNGVADHRQWPTPRVRVRHCASITGHDIGHWPYIRTVAPAASPRAVQQPEGTRGRYRILDDANVETQTGRADGPTSSVR